jgi:hypothetical protein
VFPERLADNGGDLGAFLRPIRHRSPTSRQVHQGCHGAFGAASQKSFALIQHGLLTTTQDIHCLGNGLASIRQQDNQNANDQTRILVTLAFGLAQFLLLPAAKPDPVFVRYSSYWIEALLSRDGLNYTLKTSGEQV